MKAALFKLFFGMNAFNLNAGCLYRNHGLRASLGQSNKAFHKKLMDLYSYNGFRINHLKWSIKGYEMDIKNIHSGR
jgi:hypothetical protein